MSFGCKGRNNFLLCKIKKYYCALFRHFNVQELSILLFWLKDFEHSQFQISDFKFQIQDYNLHVIAFIL